MSKRILSLILAAALLLALVPAALAYDDTPMDSEGYYYVYTENGKGLNVRDTPGGNVVGSLKYGTRIYCYYNQDGWALIDYTYNKPGYGQGTYACFVSSRFLQKSKPPARSGGSSSGSSTTPVASDSWTEINNEFASAKEVTPFKVTVRPTRVTGWVNLRWAPSKNAQLMRTYKANDTLLVIKETTNWYQVEDQDTGDVGFINKAFVTQ